MAYTIVQLIRWGISGCNRSVFFILSGGRVELWIIPGFVHAEMVKRNEEEWQGDQSRIKA